MKVKAKSYRRRQAIKLGTPLLVAIIVGIVAYLGSVGQLSFGHANSSNSQTSTSTSSYPACPNMQPVSATLCWKGDFETGDLSQYTAEQCVTNAATGNAPNSAQVVSNPVRAGSHALELSVSQYDIPANNTNGCNIGSYQHPNTKLDSKFGIQNGQDLYVGFSIYLPSNFPSLCEEKNSGPSCFFQVMEVYGPPYGGSPTLGLGIVGDNSGNGKNQFALSGAPLGYFTPLPTNPASFNIWYSPDITYGQWNDFVLRLHMSNCGGSGNFATYAACAANQSPGSQQLWWGNQSQALSRQTFYDGGQTSYFPNLVGPPYPNYSQGTGCGINYVPLTGTNCPTSGGGRNYQTNVLYMDEYYGATDMSVCTSGGSCTTCLHTDSTCYNAGYQCPAGDMCSATPSMGTVNVYEDEAKIGTAFASVVPGGSGVLPTATMTASPPSITTGQSTTLSWSSSGASSCNATSPSNWTGSTGTSGSQSLSPTTTTTYTMNCQDMGGDTATVSSTIAVSAAPSSPSPGSGGSSGGSGGSTTPNPTSTPSSPNAPQVVNLAAVSPTKPVSGTISLAGASDCSVDGKSVSCNDVNTSDLSDGQHTVVAQVREANGKVVTVKKTIDVNNHQSALKNAELKYGTVATVATLSGGSLAMLAGVLFLVWYFILRPRPMLMQEVEEVMQEMLHHNPMRAMHLHHDSVTSPSTTVTPKAGQTPRVPVASPPASELPVTNSEPPIARVATPKAPPPGRVITPNGNDDETPPASSL